MSKPTRDEFAATVQAKWPGATRLNLDRGLCGLYLVVGSRAVAEAINSHAKAAGYRPERIQKKGDEDYRVSIFGFPNVGGRYAQPAAGGPDRVWLLYLDAPWSDGPELEGVFQSEDAASKGIERYNERICSTESRWWSTRKANVQS